MAQINQVILTIDEVDEEVVVIAPTDRPCFHKSEGIAAVLKARLAINHLRMPDVEVMLASKVGVEVSIRDSTVFCAAVLNGL